MDNIIAVLEHNDRIRQLGLFSIPGSQMGSVLAAMQRPFPALVHLLLQSKDETVPIHPDSFLGGSAPRLRTLFLDCIPFPGLPTLLLSATHLVELNLWRIPHSGYISPQAMVTGLSVLTRLEKLIIGFESPRFPPDQRSRRPPPLARTLLPVLDEMEFIGVSEYLEDLVHRIDAPLLNKLAITFHQLIFDTPQLAQFIGRTPELKVHDEARVVFSDWVVRITVPQASDGRLHLRIKCRHSEWQLSSLAQVCSSSFPQAFIPAVEHLRIVEDDLSRLHWQDDIENSQWLELLLSFTAAKYLYISQEFVPHIAPALQELTGERVAEVLPGLQTLFLEGPLRSAPVQEAIGPFIDTRQLGSRPVAVSHWVRKSFED